MTDCKKTKAKWDTRTIAAAVVLFAAGFVLGQANHGFSPWQPESDRPVLRFVARVAKLGLWIMVADQPPVPDTGYVAHCKPGEQCISHREGW